MVMGADGDAQKNNPTAVVDIAKERLNDIIINNDGSSLSADLPQSSSSSSSSTSPSSSSSALEMRKSLEKIEREIVRITMIAQTDRKESMSSTVSINRCKNEVLQMCEDFYLSGHPQRDAIEKAVAEADLPLDAIVELEQTRRPMSLSKARTFTSPIDNIINATQARQAGTSPQSFQPFQAKLDELRRVQVRAKEESIRHSFMARKAEELQQLSQREVKHWKEATLSLACDIQRKEKEIERAQILAERDKRAGMHSNNQIITLRKSIEGLREARPSVELDALLDRCSCGVRVTATAPVVATSENPLFGPPRGERALTQLRRDADLLLQEESQKNLELARVRSIADSEGSCAALLKSRVEELREFVVSEIQSADNELKRKVTEIRTKQKAIEKVTARCDKDRARSFFIRGEIIRLSNELSVDSRELANFVGSDMAYMQEFREVGDTRQFAKGADLTSSPTQLPSLLPAEFVDPMEFITTPPFREISLGAGASKNIYVQKLRELETLDREQHKRDEELLRLKRIAEAERYRNVLWQEKFQELRDEVEYQHGQPMSRTY